MLDELLKDTTEEIAVGEQISVDNFTKVESEQKHIWMNLKEGATIGSIGLDKKFEEELANELNAFEELKNRIEEKKEEILNFLDKNHPKSFETEMLVVKYTSATTQTSIDSTRLKQELPEIAAKYSKTSPKKSSISIKADRVKVEE